jgi:HPr kinase/phosphorylase
MAGLTVGEFYREKKEALKLVLLQGEKGLARNRITVPDIYRPGLALAGYFNYFAFERVQVMGRTELSFLNSLSPTRREQILRKFFSYRVCCLLITQGIQPPALLAHWAQRKGVPVFSTPLATTRLVSDITIYLEDKLAPHSSMHGTLVEVYGLGALILGKSGIGKSECALELIKRGHRLVADDLIHVKRSADQVLVGWGDLLIRHHMEVRGLGIIDVKELFGVGSVRDEIQVEMVISLEEWMEGKEYERTGLDEQNYPILDLPLPHLVLPVRPGRSLAVIIEVAAMNQRLKKSGVNSAALFNRRLLDQMRPARAKG